METYSQFDSKNETLNLEKPAFDVHPISLEPERRVYRNIANAPYHLTLWISATGVFISFCGMIIALFAYLLNAQNTNQQSENSKRQNIIVSTQLRFQKQVSCILMAGQAFDEIKADPSAAVGIYTSVQASDQSCKEVGVPILGRLSILIDRNPSGISKPLKKSADSVLATLPQTERKQVSGAGFADRLSYDQSKMKQYYLTKGYADFSVVSAAAELTPDRKDLIIDKTPQK